MSKTPWTVNPGMYIAGHDGKIVLDDVECEHLELIVAAVNFYSALPEDVRKLKPETVVKCVEAIQKYADYQRQPIDEHIDHAWERVKVMAESNAIAVAALEAEEAIDGKTQ